jgi:antitoxin StbD
LYKFLYAEGMASTVVTTSEVRAELGKITKRFDAGDTEPVFFGSHRRAQAVLVPIATWEKLLAYTEDALDLDVARQRLADDRPWLSEDELDAALQRAAKAASRQKSA